MTMAESFDTPPATDVLEQDEAPMQSVPVHVEGTVRTDEMGTRAGAIQTFYLVAGARAVKVLQTNPRRKRALVWCAAPFDTETTVVLLSATEAECNAFQGVVINNIQSSNRYEFTFQDELWARPVVLSDTTGNSIVISASVDDMHLYIVAEDWAR